METSIFSETFKRDAVAQITERSYPVAEVRSVSASASIRCRLGSGRMLSRIAFESQQLLKVERV